MTAYERLEFEVCQEYDVPSMPEAFDDSKEAIWVYAIARITAYNMERSFAIVRNNIGGSPVIEKCYSQFGCARIDSIHPFRMLDSEYMGKDMTLKSMRSLVARAYGVDDKEVASLSAGKVKELMINFAIMRSANKYRSEREFAENARRNEEERRIMNSVIDNHNSDERTA